jgi:metal-responsive CopG/Arc/MetJ family transcriptional regulator
MAEKTSTVNISFRDDLLAEIDEVARSESRSRSELVREAARLYIARKKRMSAIISSIRQVAEQRGLSEKDVEDEITAHRSTQS